MIYLLICGVSVVNAFMFKWDFLYPLSHLGRCHPANYSFCGLMPFVIHFAMMLDRKFPKTES